MFLQKHQKLITTPNNIPFYFDYWDDCYKKKKLNMLDEQEIIEEHLECVSSGAKTDTIKREGTILECLPNSMF